MSAASSDDDGDRRGIRWPARLGAVVLVFHGLIHVIGFLLLWEIAEVGEFTYDMATPDSGTTPGKVVGIAWLLAAALFVATAVEVFRDSVRWRRAAVAACVVSTPALLVDAGDAFAGLVVNVVVLAVAYGAPERVRDAVGRRRPGTDGPSR